MPHGRTWTWMFFHRHKRLWVSLLQIQLFVDYLKENWSWGVTLKDSEITEVLNLQPVRVVGSELVCSLLVKDHVADLTGYFIVYHKQRNFTPWGNVVLLSQDELGGTWVRCPGQRLRRAWFCSNLDNSVFSQASRKKKSEQKKQQNLLTEEKDIGAFFFFLTNVALACAWNGPEWFFCIFPLWKQNNVAWCDLHC